MLKEIISKLKDEKVEIVTGENSIGKTLIAEKYLALVAGGHTNSYESQYKDYVQNYGDNGPHPGPYNQSIN